MWWENTQYELSRRQIGEISAYLVLAVFGGVSYSLLTEEDSSVMSSEYYLQRGFNPGQNYATGLKGTNFSQEYKIGYEDVRPETVMADAAHVYMLVDDRFSVRDHESSEYIYGLRSETGAFDHIVVADTTPVYFNGTEIGILHGSNQVEVAVGDPGEETRLLSTGQEVIGVDSSRLYPVTQERTTPVTVDGLDRITPETLCSDGEHIYFTGVSDAGAVEEPIYQVPTSTLEREAGVSRLQADTDDPQISEIGAFTQPTAMMYAADRLVARTPTGIQYLNIETGGSGSKTTAAAVREIATDGTEIVARTADAVKHFRIRDGELSPVAVLADNGRTERVAIAGNQAVLTHHGETEYIDLYTGASETVDHEVLFHSPDMKLFDDPTQRQLTIKSNIDEQHT